MTSPSQPVSSHSVCVSPLAPSFSRLEKNTLLKDFITFSLNISHLNIVFLPLFLQPSNGSRSGVSLSLKPVDSVPFLGVLFNPYTDHLSKCEASDAKLTVSNGYNV